MISRIPSIEPLRKLLSEKQPISDDEFLGWTLGIYIATSFLVIILPALFNNPGHSNFTSRTQDTSSEAESIKALQDFCKPGSKYQFTTTYNIKINMIFETINQGEDGTLSIHIPNEIPIKYSFVIRSSNITTIEIITNNNDSLPSVDIATIFSTRGPNPYIYKSGGNNYKFVDTEKREYSLHKTQ